MKDIMDFVGYLLVLSMILFMLGGLAVVGFFWNNKWKILFAVIAVIAGYLFLKKKKENTVSNAPKKRKPINNVVDVTPKKKLLK